MAHRSGSADLPLHGGRVPAWLAEPHDAARRGHRRGDRPPLRPRRVAAAPGSSVLVPVVRRGHGHGLAFLRHHHQRDRRAQARSRAAVGRTRHPCLRRPRQAFAQDAGRARGGRRAGRDSTAPRWPTRAGSWPRSTAPPSRTASISICTASSSADDGHWVVVQQGMNGAQQHGAPLSLALRGPAKLRRRRRTAAIEGPASGRNRQPDRPRAAASRKASSSC